MSAENAKGFKAAVRQRENNLKQQKNERSKIEAKQLEEAKNSAALRERETISGISQSQARLYERLSNLEVVTNDEVNFPSLADEKEAEEKKAEKKDAPQEQRRATNTETKWGQSEALRQRLEELSDYTPVLTKDEEFPTLGGSSPMIPLASTSTWGVFAQKATGNTTSTTNDRGRAGPARNDTKPKRGKGKQKQLIYSTGL